MCGPRGAPPCPSSATEASPPAGRGNCHRTRAEPRRRPPRRFAFHSLDPDHPHIHRSGCAHRDARWDAQAAPRFARDVRRARRHPVDPRNPDTARRAHRVVALERSRHHIGRVSHRISNHRSCGCCRPRRRRRERVGRLLRRVPVLRRDDGLAACPNALGPTRPIPARRCHQHRVAVIRILRRRSIGRLTHGAHPVGCSRTWPVSAHPQTARTRRLPQPPGTEQTNPRPPPSDARQPTRRPRPQG